jgi:hypothetical protein
MTQEQCDFIRELGPYSKQAVYENRQVEFNVKVFNIWTRRWPNTLPRTQNHERNYSIERALKKVRLAGFPV